jgi:NADH:ubiquinone oxidoreductase subunit F (NADH-binding)/NAD-dependent dihydropyrimidine dehydrogenase PreA subunit/(2Fe-2S) ferredoxin
MGNVTPFKNPEQFYTYADTLTKEKDTKKRVIISSATCGLAFGAKKLVETVKNEIETQNLQDEIDLRVTGCLGFCEREPILLVYPHNIFYPRPPLEKVPEIITESVMKGNPVPELLYTDPATEQKIITENEIPFYQKQKRLLFKNNKEIDPTSITDYIKVGGYQALAKAVGTMTPSEIIAEVEKSGLRGRGGAGFPTGTKWKFCRNAAGDTKYVICNADEGDPGAFMDRSLLESNPHSVLEGIIIGAYAIGASKGFIYIREEYPLAVNRLTIAIEQAQKYGFLGENILGSSFSFDIEISKGAGAFVCGEETALMASIEGKVGEPKQKPPYPAEKGLWGNPTNINNVKTWANVPIIVDKGADWYSKIGTKTSKGTMIFSLVGKINNTGLVEVPMGITLKELVYDIGGGIPNGKKLKAIQTGGPSGGCIPASMIDLTVDYESLTEAGSIMGSGGMIVMDENTCMVDVARYFVNFLKDESCGKCTPCREGLYQMYEILDRICNGEGKEEDLDTLEDLAYIMKEASLCMLGGTAPNPVLTTLRFFKDEYIAHIKDKTCPAGVCKPLIEYHINPDVCTGCGICEKSCPQNAISSTDDKIRVINTDNCIKCGVCLDVCKFDAVEVV